MGQPAASVARRIVARVMRDARLRQGMTVTKAASIAGFTQGTLTKYERAENPFPKVVVYRLADLYGIDQDMRDKLVDLAGQKEPGWWQRHREIPEWFESYIGLESEAHTVSNYEDGLIPGLLQSEDYARAVLSAAWPPPAPESVERQLAARLERQKILGRTNPTAPLLWVVLEESVLCRPVGGRDIMVDQLKHLLAMAQRPHVRLQILPFSKGAHAAMDGAFTLLEMGNRDRMLYTERPGSGQVTSDADEVAKCDQRMSALIGLALSPEESIDQLAARIGET